jgi:hypothetical protein
MTSRDDDAIEQTEQAAADESAAAKLFDIRRIIGGLFALYGVVLLVVGLVDGKAASNQAAGIDINIWTGLGMGLTGAFFLVWMWRRPLGLEPVGEGDRDGEDPDQHARRS